MIGGKCELFLVPNRFVVALFHYSYEHPVSVPIGFISADPRHLRAARKIIAVITLDDRPQRGRDACKNIMDALEAAAKEVCGMPRATFGNVLAELRNGQVLASETISVLQKQYDMADNHFRHGMTTPFVPTKA